MPYTRMELAREAWQAAIANERDRYIEKLSVAAFEILSDPRITVALLSGGIQGANARIYTIVKEILSEGYAPCP